MTTDISVLNGMPVSEALPRAVVNQNLLSQRRRSPATFDSLSNASLNFQIEFISEVKSLSDSGLILHVEGRSRAWIRLEPRLQTRLGFLVYNKFMQFRHHDIQVLNQQSTSTPNHTGSHCSRTFLTRRQRHSATLPRPCNDLTMWWWCATNCVERCTSFQLLLKILQKTFETNTFRIVPIFVPVISSSEDRATSNHVKTVEAKWIQYDTVLGGLEKKACPKRVTKKLRKTEGATWRRRYTNYAWKCKEILGNVVAMTSLNSSMLLILLNSSAKWQLQRGSKCRIVNETRRPRLWC